MKESNKMVSSSKKTCKKRVEKAAQYSEEKYRGILENIEEGYYEVDLAGNYTFFNDSMCRILGYSRDELSGMNYKDMCSLETAKRIYKIFNRVFRTGEPVKVFDYEVITKDGKKKTISISGSLTRDETGKAKGFCGIQRDITDRKRLEYAIEERAQFSMLLSELSATFVNLPPGEVDNEIEYWLKRIVYFLEIERSAMFQTLNGKVCLTHSLTIDGFKPDNNISINKTSWYAKKVMSGDVIQFSSIDDLPDEAEIEKKYFRNVGIKSSVVIPLFVSSSYIGALTFTSSTKEKEWPDDLVQQLKLVGDVFASALDRKRAVEALKENENKLKEAQKIAHLGHWELDLASNRLSWSDEIYRIFNLKADEVDPSYEMFLEMVHPDDREFVDKTYTESLKNWTPYDIVHRILLKDGTIKYVHEMCRTEYDKKRNPVRSLGTVQDITNQKQYEEKIESSLREKDILIKEIHHRVKNNMQVISSLIGLQADYINDEKDLDLFMNTDKRICSMALVHEMLYHTDDFSRVDFSDYIRELTGQLIRSYNIRTDKIELDINVRDIQLGVDNAVPCGLIINEIVSNSIKHAFPGDIKGKIAIDFYRGKDNIYKLTVSDNGIGISEDFKNDETESLGFTLINALTSQINGKIKLDIKNGTEYKIIFSGKNDTSH